ncbi:MAG: ABC transporter substrate-binding protein [Alphaproteobacteria bacterium]|nr:ABC transporter substrate-binding protein [Alphaproteobacteria bacterium]
MGAQGPRTAGGLLAALACALIALSPAAAEEIKPAHGIAMHGAPKYPADFKHFDYVNPDAPKGGEVRLYGLGTFDSLNPYILKGVPAGGVASTFDTLMTSADDEAFSYYGLVAETIEVPPDRAWVIFNLRPQARFRDGSPITAADVVWTFDTLRTKGHPRYRSYYGDVAKAEALGPLRVKFTFATNTNRELPLILGQLPVLSKAYYEKVPFDATTTEPPLGSGPYKVGKVDLGRSITLERDPNYWARDLPVNRGRFNFASMRYDYYRDRTITFEAFKGGEIDFRLEATAKDWATGYDIPPVKAGHIVKEELPNNMPLPMQGFAYNLRRPLFQDPKVRQALAYAFDFEWLNKNQFYGLYKRTTSYFFNSELASRGLPSPEELKILEPLREDLPPEVFTTEYKPPVTDGSGNIRDGLRTGLRLLKEAGWEIRENKLINVATGKPFEFDILASEPSMERVVLPFTRNLERFGITARLRVVDASQYEHRMDDFDFDMVIQTFPQSLSPGNEQREFWGSTAADERGSHNVMGIKSAAIDKLIDLVIAAPDRESLVMRTRALDRALLWGHYMIPHYRDTVYRVAYWNMFGRPAVLPKHGIALDTWWVDPAKLASLSGRRRS